jgi:hypothetical protein
MAPRNPWKLLKNQELTDLQRRELQKLLQQRERNLRRALSAVEEALKQVSRALSQTGETKYVRKILRKARRKKR